ncbi:uracil-DNA glycosylase [Blattabacterium cuenoti]|uniref:uracil-DNA glycosylase n=1 Tax=Blattabacterium cuenoti TaxID=1653831 RepID=UPI00163D27B9|nr:uracil-DNA glycosylase [Blattabacterium cuenoti]
MDKKEKNYKTEYNWIQLINEQSNKKYFVDLIKFVKKEYKIFTCFPKMNNIFSFMKYCSFQKIKVVLLGQDPYHNYNQADGLAFSVLNGTPFPPSLKNIFREIKNCFKDYQLPKSGSLVNWAKQGVLLLNSILTVRKGSPGSHKNLGWEIFTDQIIYNISIRKKNIVFLLWGKYAKNKENFIKNIKNHFVLKTTHPSPFSANLGFIGCKHFLMVNEFLKEKKKSVIIW